ncbi:MULTISPECIES: type IV pilin protein [unclassified Polaromonas]|uniref:type IV pilin protein n=1 Tax=unclassified Polaromonas TaxID=2638319 RepID=UPI001A30BA5C|nr:MULTISPECIES: type IV pilin protein [unclassified Polaromonas]MBG6071097.1 type IV pilus assembly protein PilE [Polaromonas sp. CG_9.7]MBG6113097.1 type IV pilus assembly protein PilE [Polaromonas sp. CG_9.2]MDH6185629.1 type IV pilus assembly protein PilE [Polaromonas sp. CG_23.6]
MSPLTMKRYCGFTLIELMITVAVVAILSAIALPSYNGYVLRSHRAEAKNTLLAVAQRLEQIYTLESSYAITKDAAGNAAVVNDALIASWGLNQTPLSGTARYNITFSANPTTTAFTLLATPANAQANDTCGVMLLDNRNLKGAAGQGNRGAITRECWDR